MQTRSERNTTSNTLHTSGPLNEACTPQYGITLLQLAPPDRSSRRHARQDRKMLQRCVIALHATQTAELHKVLTCSRTEVPDMLQCGNARQILQAMLPWESINSILSNAVGAGSCSAAANMVAHYTIQFTRLSELWQSHLHMKMFNVMVYKKTKAAMSAATWAVTPALDIVVFPNRARNSPPRPTDVEVQKLLLSWHHQTRHPLGMEAVT